MRNLVETHDRGRGVDRIHDVVERDRERVDVLAIERGDEAAIEPVDDRSRQALAGVFRLLDDVRRGHVGRVARQHLFEGTRALPDLLGELHEIFEELLVARNQAEAHVTSTNDASYLGGPRVKNRLWPGCHRARS